MSVTRSSEVPLLGRERELQRLVDCAERVRTGRAAVVAIGADAGLGKSRLATEALRWGRRSGFTTLHGSGGPLQRDLSYAPVVEALRALVRGPAAEVAGLVDGLSDLARLFDGLPISRPAPLGDAGLERTRLFEAVCTLLRRATRTQPFMVFLDDIHWADPGSLAMLHYLVRGLEDRPVLFVLGYRMAEQERELRDLLVALRRIDVLTEIELRPLSQQTVGDLARKLLAGEPPGALLRLLAARAGGVPLFVKALVDELVDSGSLVCSGGRWVLGPYDAELVPQVVSDLIRSRIELLSDSARAVLDALATFGGRVSHSVLQEIVPDEAFLLDGVARLVASGVIDEVITDGAVAYKASHPLLTEVAYELLPAVSRSERHAVAARAVEKTVPGDLRGIAFHVRKAGNAVDADHAYDVLRRAADEALAAQRGEEAAADLRAALAVTRRLGRTDVAAELLELLALASEVAGRAEDARVAWLEAADSAADAPQAKARCLARVAAIEWDSGEFTNAQHHLELAAELLAGTPPSDDHVIVAAARLRAANRRRDVAAERKIFAELDRLAETHGTPHAKVTRDACRAEVTLANGDFEAGLVAVERAVQEAERLADPLLAEWLRRMACGLFVGCGELALARLHAIEGLRHAQVVGVPSLEVVHRICLGFVDMFSGRWDEAMATAFDALDLTERVGMPRGTAYALSLQALILIRRGRVEDAASRVAEARDCFGKWSDADRHVFGIVDHAEVEILLSRGEVPAAVEVASASLARGPVWLALALANLGDSALAAGDIETARSAADRLGVHGGGRHYLTALASRLRGLVNGDAAMLKEAADRMAAAGVVYDELVTRLDRSQILIDSGGDIDGPALVTELTRCVEVLEQLRAQPQSDRARSLLRRLGQRPPPRVIQGRPSPLSTREEQVARLVAQGLTNAEIATRLFISQRTVTTHLQHIYAQTGLGSRTALTRYVLEQLPAETAST